MSASGYYSRLFLEERKISADLANVLSSVHGLEAGDSPSLDEGAERTNKELVFSAIKL